MFNARQTVLYGTTTAGGSGNGVVYSVGRGGGETVLYTFKGGLDGAQPGGLVTANGKTFYGATAQGGNGQGTVYRITASGAYKQVYVFANTADGHTPNTKLALDASGAIYGTAQGGGNGQGTAWVLVPPTTLKGSWNLEVMYSFGGEANDGATPAGGLILDASGNVYGVTTGGGEDRRRHGVRNRPVTATAAAARTGDRGGGRRGRPGAGRCRYG